MADGPGGGLGESLEAMAARRWAEMDAEAGNDVTYAGEWWLPSVRTGLSIPTLDNTYAVAEEGCSTEGASWLRHDRWKDWIASPFYRKVESKT
jgi:hypothetical protein